METTVTLQQPMEYSWWVLAIAALFLVLAIGLLVLALCLMKKARPVKEKQKQRKTSDSSEKLPEKNTKTKYMARIEEILLDYNAGKITKRVGYQQLSLIIREFVHGSTGIDVEKCTLKELRTMKMKNVEELIEECYVPEFAEDVRAEEKNFEVSCRKAIGVIKSWK